MNEKYPPEPWQYDGYHVGYKNGRICSCNTEDEAKRIVECVNSCAAIKHPENIYRCLTQVQERLEWALLMTMSPACEDWIKSALELIEETLGEDED